MPLWGVVFSGITPCLLFHHAQNEPLVQRNNAAPRTPSGTPYPATNLTFSRRNSNAPPRFYPPIFNNSALSDAVTPFLRKDYSAGVSAVLRLCLGCASILLRLCPGSLPWLRSYFTGRRHLAVRFADFAEHGPRRRAFGYSADRPKSRRALAVVAAATSSGATPLSSATRQQVWVR